MLRWSPLNISIILIYFILKIRWIYLLLLSENTSAFSRCFYINIIETIEWRGQFRRIINRLIAMLVNLFIHCILMLNIFIKIKFLLVKWRIWWMRSSDIYSIIFFLIFNRLVQCSNNTNLYFIINKIKCFFNLLSNYFSNNINFIFLVFFYFQILTLILL
jgi:hypothetical protein